MSNFAPMTRKLILLCGVLMAFTCHAQHFNTVSHDSRIMRPWFNTPGDETPEEEVEEEEVIQDTIPSNLMLPTVALPLKTMKITSVFGVRRNPFGKNRKMHSGLDLQARYEPCYAMLPGTVVRVGADKVSGKFVTMRHGDILVSYCHLSRQFVKEGDHVSAGNLVALTGNTGRSTGPHLHISCRIAGEKKRKYFDPMVVLRFVKHNIKKLN